MSQYKTGTVLVTNGSQVVTGTGTAWLSNVQPGDGFSIAGSGVPYTVGAVDSDGQITLSAAYAGPSGSGLAYAIWRDFEEVTGAPELSHGDIETATIFTRAVRKIGQAIAGVIPGHLAETNPHPQYLLDTKYGQNRLREALLKEATLNLDFANNKYEVYEGPADSLTQRPFNDILDYSRSSGASARNATGGITEVLADQQRLVGNRDGLLIEEQRTNLTRNSERIDTWSLSGVNVTADAEVSPRGDSTADFIQEGSTATPYVVSTAFGLASGNKYAVSAYFKAAGREIVRMALTGGNGEIRFNIATETIVTSSGTDNEGVEALGNGWYRAWFVITSSIDGNVSQYIEISDNVVDGGEGLYVWGAQTEQGSFPTSYIKTEGSQVTRSADNCNRTLVQELNREAFTYYAEFKIPYEDQSGAPIYVGSAAPTERVAALYSGGVSGVGRFRFIKSEGGSTTVTDTGDTGVRSGNSVRMALSFNGSVVQLAINGTVELSGLDVSGIDTSAFDTLKLANTGGSTIPSLCRRRLLIPRALSQSELEALTGGS